MEIELDNFDIDTKEDKLLETFEHWFKDSQTYHDWLLTFQKQTEEYYKGNQTERDAIAARQTANSDTVENRVFEAVETIVPIVTAKAHQFIVLPGSENETSVDRANRTQKILSRKYETIEMQRKLEEVTRQILLYRFGCMKWEWSYEKDDVDVKVVDPRLIMVPRMRLNPHDLPYKIEIQEYSKKEMEEFWPGYDINKLSTEERVDVGSTGIQRRKCYRVYEVWTPEMVVWFCSKQLLERKANPYFDFEGEEKSYIKKNKKGAKLAKKLVFANVFDRPTDPYVFFSTYNVGDEPFASISLVEVALSIQDAINVQKRKIIDNLRRMGNGQVYMDSDAMSKEESDNITDEVGLIIRGEGLASQGKIKRDPGVPLPNAHFSNLTHSEAVFDNVMGVHSATRGNAQAGTLGQDIMSRQQDFTRVDLITRILNRGVARIAMGLVQMMKMFYTETQVVKIIGEEGAVEFVRLNRDDINDYIEIVVKGGDNLPMDKVSLRTEAVQLWQLGALDPTTLFERLDFPNPAKAAERLVAWKQGQLTAETQSKIAEIAAGAKFGAEFAAPPAGAAPAKASAPTAKPESGRSIETPMNVMQRATAGVGGTANLTATPKM